MRVKLSYTVEAEDVLREASKIIGLQQEDLQQAVNLFGEVQKELRGENDEESGVVNIHKAQEMLEEFRKALLTIDRRLDEVTEIVHGYDDYLRSMRPGEDVMDPASPPEPDDDPELFGAD
jgi:hypothetical protein